MNIINYFNKTLEDIYNEYCSHREIDSINDTKNILLWHVVFIIITPLILYNHYGYKSFRYYLPLIDLIAAGFVYVGSKHIIGNSENIEVKQHYFNGLYEIIPKNTLSYVSSNIINLMALSGVGIHSILWAEKKGVLIGVGIAIIMYLVTYLMPSLLLPKIIDILTEKIDKYFLDSSIKKKKQNKHIKIIEELGISIGLILLLLYLEGNIINLLVLNE